VEGELVEKLEDEDGQDGEAEGMQARVAEEEKIALKKRKIKTTALKGVVTNTTDRNHIKPHEGAKLVTPHSHLDSQDAARQKEEHRDPGRCYKDPEGDVVYIAKDDETPRQIAKKQRVALYDLLELNIAWYKAGEIKASSKLREGTALMLPPREPEWQHGPWVGCKVSRRFDGVVFDGVVVAHVAECEGLDEPALWLVRHYDGDEEALEEHEMKEAIQLWSSRTLNGYANMAASEEKTTAVVDDREVAQPSAELETRLLAQEAPSTCTVTIKTEPVEGTGLG